MKNRSIIYTMLCSLMLGMSFTACSDDDDDEPGPIVDPTAENLTYILNEGSWGGNNAEISLYYQMASSPYVESNYFQKMNGKKMGDVANAMIEEDDHLYVLLNGSRYVARLDMACKEEARYTFPATEGEPRCIEVEDGYVYVTQYGGQVSKINVKDMTLVSTFKGGDNLEGIVEKDGKLYVANSYKQNGSGNFEYNKEVLVIDAKTMQQTGSIQVVVNPTKIYEINDRIYVLSQGNYKDIQAALQVIDTKAGTAKSITNAAKITEGNNNLIYGVRSVYDASWQLTNSFFTYNPSTGAVSESSFLQDAPSSFSTAAIYLLEVDEDRGLIYVGTSDYVTNGTIYQFDRNGKLLQSFDSGGLNPSAMIFID